MDRILSYPINNAKKFWTYMGRVFYMKRSDRCQAKRLSRKFGKLGSTQCKKFQEDGLKLCQYHIRKFKSDCDKYKLLEESDDLGESENDTEATRREKDKTLPINEAYEPEE